MTKSKSDAVLQNQLETLQDVFIFLLLRDSVPQQVVRKIVGVELKRVTRIGKLFKKSER